MARSIAIGHTWLGRSYWGAGHNVESKLLAAHLRLRTLGAVRVVWHTDIKNERSQAAIERLGAQREGVMRKHRLRRDGSWRDTVQFAMTDDDWLTARPALEARLAAFARESCATFFALKGNKLLHVYVCKHVIKTYPTRGVVRMGLHEFSSAALNEGRPGSGEFARLSAALHESGRHGHGHGRVGPAPRAIAARCGRGAEAPAVRGGFGRPAVEVATAATGRAPDRSR